MRKWIKLLPEVGWEHQIPQHVIYFVQFVVVAADAVDGWAWLLWMADIRKILLK